MERRQLEQAVHQALWNAWTGGILGMLTIGILTWWIPHYGFGQWAAGMTAGALFALWMGAYNGLQYRRLRVELMLEVLGEVL